MVGSPHRRFRRYFSFHQTHLPLPYPFMCPPPHTFLPYHHRHHHLHHRRRQHHLFHRPYPIRPTHMPRMGSQLRAKLPPPSHRRSRRHHQDMEGRTTRRKGQGRLRHRRRNGERVEGAVYRRIWQGRRKSRHGRLECSRYNVIYHRRRRDRQNIQTYLRTKLESPRIIGRGRTSLGRWLEWTLALAEKMASHHTSGKLSNHTRLKIMHVFKE